MPGYCGSSCMSGVAQTVLELFKHSLCSWSVLCSHTVNEGQADLSLGLCKHGGTAHLRAHSSSSLSHNRYLGILEGQRKPERPSPPRRCTLTGSEDGIPCCFSAASSSLPAFHHITARSPSDCYLPQFWLLVSCFMPSCWLTSKIALLGKAEDCSPFLHQSRASQ